MKDSSINSTLVCISLLILAAGCSNDKSRDNTQRDIITATEVTADSVRLNCSVPEMEFVTENTTDGEFTILRPLTESVKIQDGSIGADSTPQAPTATFFMAFPCGATEQDVSIDVTGNGASAVSGLRLYPLQKPPRALAGVDDDNSFAYDKDVYLGTATSHENVRLLKIESIDDANIWQVTVNLIDYDPAEQIGTFYDSLDIGFDFSGDTGCYSLKRMPVDGNGGPVTMDEVDEWIEESAPNPNKRKVENETILSDEDYRDPSQAVVSTGGARFIIVSHPDFAAAANTLAAHKESLGISTMVVLTSAIAPNGMTDLDLHDALIGYYNTWSVRPKWVLLMGDAEFIPTHSDSVNNSYEPVPNAGDMYYGQINGEPLDLPVFGIGRLPVDTLEQANIIVDKIIAYETDPPGNDSLVADPYYYTLTFASYFQDTDDDHPEPDGKESFRFASIAEHIRTHLIGENYTVNRIYSADAGIDPERWGDDTEVPMYLRRPAFAWDGNTQDVIDDINEGTSVMFHKDHGNYWGWGEPSFTTSDLDDIAITDNKYPVVYSSNCMSGYFDQETLHPGSTAVSWSEQFIRNGQGAIGVIASNRSGSNGISNAFAQGLFDATWPSYLDYDGEAEDVSIRKLGDILTHAKGYIMSLTCEESKIRQQCMISNLLGDPTVELLSRPRMTISPATPTWQNRARVEVTFEVHDPSDIGFGRTPIVAVAVEPNTGAVVGRALLAGEDIAAGNRITIPIDEAKLGNYSSVNVYLSGSDFRLSEVQADLQEGELPL